MRAGAQTCERNPPAPEKRLTRRPQSTALSRAALVETVLFYAMDLPRSIYELFAAYVARPRSAVNTPYTVHHADGVSTVALNQRNPTNL